MMFPWAAWKGKEKKTSGKTSARTSHVAVSTGGRFRLSKRQSPELGTRKDNSISRKASVAKCLETIEYGLLCCFYLYILARKKEFQLGGKKDPRSDFLDVELLCQGYAHFKYLKVWPSSFQKAYANLYSHQQKGCSQCSHWHELVIFHLLAKNKQKYPKAFILTLIHVCFCAYKVR